MKISFWVGGLVVAVAPPLTSLAQTVEHRAPVLDALAADYSVRGAPEAGGQMHVEAQSDSNGKGDDAISNRSYGSSVTGLTQVGAPREMAASTYSVPVRVIGR